MINTKKVILIFITLVIILPTSWFLMDYFRQDQRLLRASYKTSKQEIKDQYDNLISQNIDQYIGSGRNETHHNPKYDQDAWKALLNNPAFKLSNRVASIRRIMADLLEENKNLYASEGLKYIGVVDHDLGAWNLVFALLCILGPPWLYCLVIEIYREFFTKPAR